jgi:cytochrome c oxidase assembly protein subunit 15
VAWVLSAATLILLAAGALVTGTGSSLAVPDWPLAYGRLFPPMVGGILFEHGHRLIAASVGLLSLALALVLWWTEPRRWVRNLAWGAVGLVLFQGLLGGITVLLLLPRAVSISHALFAQLFFLATVVLVQVTAPGWPALAASARPRERAVAGWGLAAVLALLAQLVLGATVRHNGAGLAIPDFPLAYGGLIPPLESFPVAIHFAHRVGAVVVMALLAVAAVKSLRRGRSSPLFWPAMTVVALVIAQWILGGAVIWSQKAVAVTTAHLVAGAALLGSAGLLTLRAFAGGREAAS